MVSEILIRLLRIALGNEDSFRLPDSVDWEEVIQLAMLNGLDALAFDGLNVLYDHSSPEVAAALDASLSEKKYDWLSLTMQAEQDYEAYREKLGDLSAFLWEERFRIMVLKGYGLSLDYPIPAHRPTGDIDLYLYGRGEEADARIQAKLGIEVKQEGDKHSRFRYQGLSVENHASFLSVVEHPSLRGIEAFLKQEAQNAPVVKLGDAEICIPSPTMNAVFLPCHMASHFVFEGMPLKQLVDWAVFVMRHGKEVDWKIVRHLAEQAGSFEFFRAMNGIAASYFGVSSECLPDWGQDVPLEKRIWEDTWRPKRDLAARSALEKVRDFFSLNWKFRLVYRESLFTYAVRHGLGLLRGRLFPGARRVWG